jgi:hypothetical protein
MLMKLMLISVDFDDVVNVVVDTDTEVAAAAA